MKVKELIKLLKNAKPNATVKLYDKKDISSLILKNNKVYLTDELYDKSINDEDNKLTSDELIDEVMNVINEYMGFKKK